MKKLMFVSVVLLGLLSCTKDLVETPETEEALKAVKFTEGNVTYYVGQGFNPSKKYPEQPTAFEPWVTRGTTNFSDYTIAGDIEYTEIATQQSLDKFIRQIATRESNFFGLFKVKKVLSDIEKKIKINEKTVHIVFRVKYALEKLWIPKSEIDYSPGAKKLLDKGDNFNSFFRKHGISYVKSVIMGGDAYYIYSYRSNSINSTNRSRYQRSLAQETGRLFNLDLAGNFRNSNEKVSLEEVTYNISTDLGIGLSPVKTVSQANRESVKISRFLQKRKNRIPIYSEYVPYEYPEGRNTAELRKEFNRQRTCFARVEEWAQLKNQLDEHRSNDIWQSLYADRYDDAFEYLETILTNAEGCGSTPRTVPTVQDLISRYSLTPNSSYTVKIGGYADNSWAVRGNGSPGATQGTSEGNAERMRMKIQDYSKGLVTFDWSPKGDGRYFGAIAGNSERLMYGGHGIQDPRVFFFLEHLQGDEYQLRSRSLGTYVRPPGTNNAYWYNDAQAFEQVVRIKIQ